MAEQEVGWMEPIQAVLASLFIENQRLHTAASFVIGGQTDEPAFLVFAEDGDTWTLVQENAVQLLQEVNGMGYEDALRVLLKEAAPLLREIDEQADHYREHPEDFVLEDMGDGMLWIADAVGAVH